MSNKKSLLTESEIRRLMTLANIPALNEGSSEKDKERGEKGISARQDKTTTEAYEEQDEGKEEMDESYGQEEENMTVHLKEEGEEEEEEEGAEEPPADEEMPEEEPEEAGDEMGSVGGNEELKAFFDSLKAVLKPEFADQFEVEDTAGGEEGEEGEEEMPMPPEGGEGEEAPPEEEGAGMMQESLVNAVLARVSARLIAEAKKKKKDEEDKKKKKMTAAEKMKALKKKKKALEEANAPAPKSSMTNASKAGVAKGAGKADKGTWGVSSPRKDDKWAKGTNKGGDKMEEVSASAEHIVTHGKKNLATQGGNKKK